MVLWVCGCGWFRWCLVVLCRLVRVGCGWVNAVGCVYGCCSFGALLFYGW